MELANRLDIEQRLASRLAVLGANQRREILSSIGDPPDVERLTDEFWVRLEKAYRDELSAQALIIYLLMLRQHWDDWQPLAGRIPTDVGVRAAAWSSGYGADATSRFFTTTRQRLADRRGSLATMSGDRLRAELVDVLGPSRIAGAAVTGTTEAASAGSLGARDELNRKLGINLIAVWRTESDPRVCPICRPLAGMVEPAWRDSFPNGPPAHPLCRCHLDFIVLGGAAPSAN